MSDETSGEVPQGSEREYASAVSDFGITGGVATRGRPEAREADVRFDLAAVLRRLNTATVGLPIPDDDMRKATAALEEIADSLEKAASTGRRVRGQPDVRAHPQDFFPTSPVIGFANPIAPPVKVEWSGSELHGSAFFDYPYEGPPACVHGGVIALVFDELLGAANIGAGTPAMTGTLTVKYRRPTPLRTPLTLRARQVEHRGRKVFTWGAIYLGDSLLAEAEGIFIQLDPQRFLEIAAQAADRSADRSAE